MDSLTDLEERIAHLTRQVEDLSDVVTDQAGRLARCERRLQMLMERAAEEQAQTDGQIPLADQRPPHW